MRHDLDASIPVGELVVRHPETREVLERHGIDYCCGGGHSLGTAAERAGEDVSEVLSALRSAVESASSSARSGERSWADATLSDLVDHIEGTHHVFMKDALPRVGGLFRKVLAAHGARHGDMLERLRAVFGDMRVEIEQHLRKEEQVLFPCIRELDAALRAGGSTPEIQCGTVQNPIRQMEAEHDHAGSALERMRAITASYTLPDDACPTFEALYDALQEIEADLHLHIHLENNVLFPRVLEQAG